MFFEGEKNHVFWLGLFIVGLASLTLFWVAWGFGGYLQSTMSIPDTMRLSPVYVLNSAMPLIVGGIVFLLIGFYMMKSGVKKQIQNTLEPKAS